MLELRLVQGSLLKKVLDSIKDLVTDVNLECSATGVFVHAVDFSNITMVDLHLRADGFERYRCDRHMTLGVNLNIMSKILGCAEKDDIITLQVVDCVECVTFIFTSPTGKISVFEMKLVMDIDDVDDYKHLEILEILHCEYRAIVQMPFAEFAKICKDLSTFGDNVGISLTKQGVNFSIEDGGKVGVHIISGRNTRVDAPESAATTLETKWSVLASTFPLRYINSFIIKAAPLSSTVTIILSYHQPVVVLFEHKIAEMGYIKFYLAPNIKEDEY